MEIKAEHKKQIKETFRLMKDKEDLLSLFNFSKQLIYGEKTHLFELKQLTYHSNPTVNPNRYTTFSIRKKSGTLRQIHAPKAGLKALQRCLNLILQCIFVPHEAATGFISQRSIVENATIHTGSNYVYNIDLKDFFSSIDQARVWKCFQNKPFNLNEETGTLELANILSALCCTKMYVERINEKGEWERVKKNALPQGAPTSPIITNIVCQRLDLLLTGVGNRFGLRYTRYADDITFSSMHNVYGNNHAFQQELHRIIGSQNFHIKEEKTRLQKRGYRQEVTGLLVNKKVNVHNRYIKRLRNWLYLWETYGYDKACSFFVTDYETDKGYTKNEVPDMIYVMDGKLNYLKMVKGGDNAMYQKLKHRFNELTKKLSERELSPAAQVPEARPTEKEMGKFSPIVNTIHTPKHVAEFMSLFNDPYGLKYLTHDYDDTENPFNIEKFLREAKTVFERKTQTELSIPPSLWRIVNEFAFSKKPDWGFIYKEGWSKDEWIKWSTHTHLHPKKNQRYADVIQGFRELTRIEAPRLEKIFDGLLYGPQIEKYRHLSINIKDCEKADFYTNVTFFQKGIEYILDGIAKYSKAGDKLEISYKRENEGNYIKRIITVLHHNSFSHRPCDEVLKGIKEGKGELYEVVKNFTGFCNWSIESKWADQPIRLNILKEPDSVEEVEQIPTDEVQGFKHIITFYYK